MSATLLSADRPQSPGEEIANSISHGLGLLFALIATPFLIVSCATRHDAAAVVGAVVFGVSMMILYGASMMYHALPHGPLDAPSRAKRLFKTLDHSAIYLLIAGTYTPFTLGVLRGGWGWTLFGLIWGMALLGVTLKLMQRMSHPWLSTGLYLAMGWLVLVAIKPLSESLSSAGMAWLVAGGVAYTAGVVFYVADARWRYAHFIWHLFVLAGTACHFIAVYGYAAG